MKKSTPAKFDLRDLCIVRYDPKDLEQIMEIENSSFAAPWTKQSYEELAPLDTISFWEAKIGDEVAGYMLFQHIGGEMELHTFAVAPNFRRVGIARKLLRHMISEARVLEVRRIFLQVRPSNAPARALYDSLGFKSIGVRRKYYRDDGEDALVMKLDLN